jgi:hypothetical protein
MIDSYVDWRDACARLRSAYDRWFASDVSDLESSRLTSAACAAALEQEERAAREYQTWVERVAASTPTIAST